MIAIKDDIIPELYQDRIYSMMTNTVFPWTFLQDVTYREQDIVKNINANATGTTGFAHLFYDRQNEHESRYWDFLFPLFLTIVDNPNFELLRAKGGLLLNTNSGYNHAHIDADMPHTTTLYYVNDSDGDTYFFDNDGSVIQTVKPKKGRIVTFNGLTYHSSSCPVENSHRLVLNFNYVI